MVQSDVFQPGSIIPWYPSSTGTNFIYTNTYEKKPPMYLSAAEIVYLQRCIKTDAKLARILYELLKDVKIEADLDFGVEEDED